MTLSEFKAWLSGFTEMMEGPPNAIQWERIQAKIAQINEKPMPVTVYREYVERFRPYWPAYGGGFVPTLTTGSVPRNGGMTTDLPPLSDLGRAEFRSMAAG